MHVLLFKVQLIAPGISNRFKSPPKLLKTKAAVAPTTTTTKNKTKLELKVNKQRLGFSPTCSHVGSGKNNEAQVVKMDS